MGSCGVHPRILGRLLPYRQSVCNAGQHLGRFPFPLQQLELALQSAAFGVFVRRHFQCQTDFSGHLTYDVASFGREAEWLPDDILQQVISIPGRLDQPESLTNLFRTPRARVDRGKQPPQRGEEFATIEAPERWHIANARQGRLAGSEESFEPSPVGYLQPLGPAIVGRKGGVEQCSDFRVQGGADTDQVDPCRKPRHPDIVGGIACAAVAEEVFAVVDGLEPGIVGHQVPLGAAGADHPESTQPRGEVKAPANLMMLENSVLFEVMGTIETTAIHPDPQGWE